MGHCWSKEASERRRQSLEYQKSPLSVDDVGLSQPAPPQPDPSPSRPDNSSHVVTNEEIQGNVISAVFSFSVGVAAYEICRKVLGLCG